MDPQCLRAAKNLTRPTGPRNRAEILFQGRMPRFAQHDNLRPRQLEYAYSTHPQVVKFSIPTLYRFLEAAKDKNGCEPG